MITNRALLSLYDNLFSHYGEQYWWPADTADEVIIGAVLTQNTNWQNVVKAINNLKAQNLCNLTAIEHCPQDVLSSLIRPSGYYNIKAARLQAVCGSLNRVSLPDLSLSEARKYLLQIKGVGDETADSILLYAYNFPVFVIDAYTLRLINRLFPGNNLRKYSEYQTLFHNNLPQNSTLFNEYHALIVKHSVTHCKKRPICEGCPLQSICPCYSF